jgi:hypothetical protein
MASTTTPRHSDEEEEGKKAAIAFIWVLVAFKVVTMLMIFWHLRTTTSFLILASTFWYWIPIIGFLIAGPLAWRYRLLRARARRKQLVRSEWMVELDGLPQDEPKRVQG